MTAREIVASIRELKQRIEVQQDQIDRLMCAVAHLTAATTTLAATLSAAATTTLAATLGARQGEPKN
jgi:methyl-accepting chemotaxis protein